MFCCKYKRRVNLVLSSFTTAHSSHLSAAFLSSFSATLSFLYFLHGCHPSPSPSPPCALLFVLLSHPFFSSSFSFDPAAYIHPSHSLILYVHQSRCLPSLPFVFHPPLLLSYMHLPHFPSIHPALILEVYPSYPFQPCPFFPPHSFPSFAFLRSLLSLSPPGVWQATSLPTLPLSSVSLVPPHPPLICLSPTLSLSLPPSTRSSLRNKTGFRPHRCRIWIYIVHLQP